MITLSYSKQEPQDGGGGDGWERFQGEKVAISK